MGAENWDIYECDGDHKIIIENDRDEVMTTIACPVCRNIAVYNGSVEKLEDVDKEVEKVKKDAISTN